MHPLSQVPDDAAPAPARPPLPAIVWATGWVSLLTDLSTEMIYGALPQFYQGVLRINVAAMGIIEGAAETIVSLTKLFSGHLSDRTGGRKWWMVAGYSLSTLAKPMMLLAPSAGGGWTAGTLRAADRLGKGIRGAPRDALLANHIAGGQRGRAFGVQRAMDHAGALLGGLLAAAALYFNLAQIEQLFWWTLLPGGLAVLVILFFIHEDGEPTEQADGAAQKSPRSLAQSWRAQSPIVKRYLVVIGIFALGNSSDLLLLALSQERFEKGGFSTTHATAMVVLLWSWLHVIKSLASPWGGRWSDRVGRRKPLLLGWGLYAIVYTGFAIWVHPVAPWVLFALYGLFYGFFEGPERALVADLTTDPSQRGMAYGLLNFVAGLAALPATALTGFLWWRYGPEPAFLTCAGLALLAALLLPWALGSGSAPEAA